MIAAQEAGKHLELSTQETIDGARQDIRANNFDTAIGRLTPLTAKEDLPPVDAINARLVLAFGYRMKGGRENFEQAARIADEARAIAQHENDPEREIESIRTEMDAVRVIVDRDLCQTTEEKILLSARVLNLRTQGQEKVQSLPSEARSESIAVGNFLIDAGLVDMLLFDKFQGGALAIQSGITTYRQAETIFNQRLSQNLQDTEAANRRARALNVMAAGFNRLNSPEDLQEALRIESETHTAFVEEHDARGAADSAVLIGTIHQKLGNNEQARAWYEKALSIAAPVYGNQDSENPAIAQKALDVLPRNS